jgi:hypothetical protein
VALADHAEGQARLREVLERPASPVNKKTPSMLAEGLSVHLPTPVRGVEGSNKTTLVLEVGKSFHEIRAEIERWREILAVPYQEHSLRR